MNLHPDFKIFLFYENIEYIATQSGSLKFVYSRTILDIIK